MERLYNATIDRALRDAEASARLTIWGWEEHGQMRRYFGLAAKSVGEERVFWTDMGRAARKQALRLHRMGARRMAIARASLLSLEDQLRASVRLKGAA